MISIGHDIIEIKRIQRAIDGYGSSFLRKVFVDVEIEYCLRKINSYQSFAARFAAKEAVSKALGCGIGKHLSWKSVYIENNASGKPAVVLDKKGTKLLSDLGGREVLISLTHTKELASAVAIVN